MAEVFGSIGDQPVELTNAASEVTLKALLEVAKAQFAAQGRGKGSKQDQRAQKELEKKLNNLADAAAKNTKSFTNKTKAVNTAQKAMADETQARRMSTREARQQAQSSKKSGLSISAALDSAASGITNVARGLQNMGDSITSATSVMSGMVSQLPFFGSIIGAGMDMVAGAIDNSQKSFMQAASVGANFQGSLENLINTSTEVGLTFEQYSGIVSRNGDALRFLGTSVAEGTKRFSEIGRAFRSSNLQDELAYLGFNTETINEGMLNYTVQLQRAGVNVRNLAPEELVERTGQYLKNLDAVSKLTGQSRKELEQQRMERQRDIRVRATQNRLQDDNSRQMYQSLLDITRNMSPVVEKAFKDSFFGVIDSQEAQDFSVFGQEALEIIQRVGGEALRTGNLTTQGADQIIQALAKVGVDIQQEDMFRTLATIQGSMGEMGVGLANGVQLQGRSIADITNQQAQEIAERERLARETDPANLVRTQQQIAESSNEMNKTLLKMGDTLLDTLKKFNESMVKIMDWIQKFIDDPLGTLKESAAQLGKAIADGFINMLPKWLTRWLIDSENKTEAEIQRDTLQGRLDRADLNPEFGGEPLSSEEKAKLQAEVDELNNRIRQESRNQRSGVPGTPEPTPVAVAEDTSGTREAVAKAQEEAAEVAAEQAKATVDNTKATKANTDTVRAASTCELDYSSPQALFNSFAKIMVGGRPGATDAISGTSVSDTTADVASAATAAVNGIVLPASGVATSLFGMRNDPFGSGRQQFHSGVDIAASLGTDILAPEGGTARVKKQLDAAGNLTGWGNYIEIVNEQDQVIHRLAHLAEATIKDGERVLAGQMIGKMGSTGSSTGSHLHWEMYQDGKRVDPLKAMGLSVSKGQMVTPTNPAGEMTPEAAQNTGAITPAPTAPGAPAASNNVMNATSSQLESLNTSMGEVVGLSREMVEQNRKIIIAINNLNDVVKS